MELSNSHWQIMITVHENITNIHRILLISYFQGLIEFKENGEGRRTTFVCIEFLLNETLDPKVLQDFLQVLSELTWIGVNKVKGAFVSRSFKNIVVDMEINTQSLGKSDNEAMSEASSLSLMQTD
jgi:hypothetical protein